MKTQIAFIKRLVAVVVCLLTLITATISFPAMALPSDADKMNDLLSTSYNVTKYTSPVWEGNIVYNEAVFPIKSADGAAEYTLMYEPDRVLSVYDATFSKRYTAGRDYTVSGNKITFLENGSISLRDYTFVHPQSNPENYGADKYFPRLAAGDGKWEYWGENADFYAGYINVTYTHADSWSGYKPANQASGLPITSDCILNNKAMNVVFFGDSITVGANSSGFYNIYPYAATWTDQLVAKLKQDYGCTNISSHKSAVGGSTSGQMLEKLEESVVAYSPDLVFIGFGMNDILVGASSSPESVASQYKSNIEAMITKTRTDFPDCEFVLVSPIYANTYVFRTEYFDACRDALKELAEKYEGVVCADVTSMHSYLLSFKDYLDLSGNNMCHPNDFMARIYAQVCLETIVPGGLKPYVPSGLPPYVMGVSPALAQITDTGSADFTVEAAAYGEISYSWMCSDSRIILEQSDGKTVHASVGTQLEESFTATLVCTLTDAKGLQTTSETVTLEYISTYTPTLPGDVNGDGRVNVSDVNMLKRAIVGAVEVTDRKSLDVNSDGRFNVSDINALLRILVGAYPTRN